MHATTQASPLITINQRHAPPCQPPPILDSDDGQYYACFENAFREQYIYVRDRASGEARLYAGSNGWDSPYPVKNGRVKGIALNLLEQIWLCFIDQVASGKAALLEQCLFDAVIAEVT